MTNKINTTKRIVLSNGILEINESGEQVWTGLGDPIPNLCRNCGHTLSGVWAVYCPGCRIGEREAEDKWIEDKMLELEEIKLASTVKPVRVIRIDGVKQKPDLVGLILSKTDKTESGCWIWKGTCYNKTPQIRVSGVTYTIRRELGCTARFEKSFCKNSLCVNPEHFKK